MLCKIADLIVEIPELGGVTPRLGDYAWEGDPTPDIVIRESDFRPDSWKGASAELYNYLESGAHFYANLLYYGGMMLHASAVAYGGRAYLFSGPCGIGKSTHTRLWRSCFGEEAVVFNDDKPALRFLDGRWYAYGTPWCGKDGINVNMRVPLAGICFLEQGRENEISLLQPAAAIPLILQQTLHWFKSSDKAYGMLNQLRCMLDHIPVYRLVNRPEPEAARLSYETMLAEALRRGL
jgi:hypothetical protein